MRLSRRPSDPEQTLGHLRNGHVFVMLQRGDYWQCAFVIPKGEHEHLRSEGLEVFRETIAAIVPFMRDRLDELKRWDDIKLLTVLIDCLRQWSRPGLLCIGDAAHAMSPIGGVGINLAIQDAVAAANILVEPLQRGAPSADDLQRVQRRREFPTRMTQRLQMFIQDRVISRVLGRNISSLPLAARLLRDWPILRRIPARVVGLGFRPEHVKIPTGPPRLRQFRKTDDPSH
jgi:2-polyprenyl-6-methoxyphenol hydroxylase-like FAD-dependent oxidoreductase